MLAGFLSSAWTNHGAFASDKDSGPPSDRVTDQDRRFWSFQKLVRQDIPVVAARKRVLTPVDSFVLSRLEDQRLLFSPNADRQTVLRRLSLDLVGVPPTPTDATEFLTDESPDAYERQVDRLLASPHFGERWGRHWLDVAGYVDTVGFDVDVDQIITSERKWLYRDYVIHAFNDDKPYDRFLHEQLAGDELVNWRQAPQFSPDIRELLVATGYLRNAHDFTHEDVGNIPQNFFGTLHDTLEIVGSSLLGLTLNCARCHDHKFDPVPQADYYRMMAHLTPAYNPSDWKIVFPYDKKLPDRTLADVSLSDRAEIERHNAEIERQIVERTEKLNELRQPYRDRLFEQKLQQIPEPIRADTKAAVAVPADKRNDVQTYLAAKFAGSLKVTDDEVAAALSESDKSTALEIGKQTSFLSNQRKSFGKIQALFDVGPPPVNRLLIRGDFENPGQEVPPGFLRVLCDSDSLASLPTIVPPYPGTNGWRLALARWLTMRESRAEGLVSRVMVNRIWQHLFQTGIVSTPENFGFGGAAPTHPQLMEWLSHEFAESGWKLKRLIRSIVCSTVYRQSAESGQDNSNGIANASVPTEVDPDNRLLWHMPLKRLDSEAIRDCILASCGTLDSTIGGAPIMLEGKSDGMIVIAEKQLPTPTAKWRRSVYLLARRAFQLSELAVFDQPVVATNCPERSRSAVPLQSLALLNGAFLWDQAEQFAAELSKQKPQMLDEQIRLAFQRVLVRQPTEEEFSQSVRFLDHQSDRYRGQGRDAELASQRALAHLCHSLLNTSEFLYSP